MDRSQQLSNQFNVFSEDCRHSSPLYEFLALEISKNKEILALCERAKSGQPTPNMLLGAVHYLLLSGKDHSLGTFYPSITPHPKRIDDVFPYFLDFCRHYHDEIIPILQAKHVQTNEVRRCAYLYPIFCLIHDKVKQPLSLIEIGTSAGLQLFWDQYSYSYGTNDVFGNPDAEVHLQSKYHGKKPPLYTTSPPIAAKVGLDLHINDIRNPHDYLWLKALIWPEHNDRRTTLANAAKCFQENSVDVNDVANQPVELIEGDGIALLMDVAGKLPQDSPICIFHTHVANQLPEEKKYELLGKVKAIGQKREVFHIYNNMWDNKLHLDYISEGVQKHYTVGHTDSHGRWFEWGLPDTL